VSVKIRYKLTEKDVREAVLRHKGLGSKVAAIVGIFMCGMSVLSVVLDSTHPPLGFIPFFFGLVVIFLPWLQARQMFRRGGSPLRDEAQVEISDSGFVGVNSVTSSTSTWGAFTRYLESKNLFLVYRSEMFFTIVPKRAFAAGEEEAVRSLLEQHLGAASKAYRRKIKPRTWVLIVAVILAIVVLVVTNVMIRKRAVQESPTEDTSAVSYPTLATCARTGHPLSGWAEGERERRWASALSPWLSHQPGQARAPASTWVWLGCGKKKFP